MRQCGRTVAAGVPENGAPGSAGAPFEGWQEPLSAYVLSKENVTVSDRISVVATTRLFTAYIHYFIGDCGGGACGVVLLGGT